MPAARFEASAERAAYLLIAETIRNSSVHRAQVSAKHLGDRLVVNVIAEGGLPMPLPEIEDRIAAMGGNLAIDAAPDDQVIIRAEIPCAS
jgi:signal transduction histidine kinase